VIDSSVGCTIDFSGQGKQVGHLSLAKITNTAGWASTFVHIAQVAIGDGPTVLVLAGSDRGEYEGQGRSAHGGSRTLSPTPSSHRPFEHATEASGCREFSILQRIPPPAS